MSQRCGHEEEPTSSSWFFSPWGSTPTTPESKETYETGTLREGEQNVQQDSPDLPYATLQWGYHGLRWMNFEPNQGQTDGPVKFLSVVISCGLADDDRNRPGLLYLDCQGNVALPLREREMKPRVYQEVGRTLPTVSELLEELPILYEP